MPADPLFSIIIPTRDRSALCIAAIRSILQQNYEHIEVVVVNDGSDVSHRKALDALKDEALPPGKIIRWHHLKRYPQGHGVAFVRNLGVSLSHGSYIGMLDDDDIWVDQTYLSKIARAIKSQGPAPDLIFANQEAMQAGEIKTDAIWLEPLTEVLLARAAGVKLGETTAVNLDDLLLVPGFCHLNTTICTRSLFDCVRGFDLCLRYESDRDLYLRIIDAAKNIAYLPDVVARHHIPDAQKTDNVSTRVNWLEKRLYQTRILQKAALQSASPKLRKHSVSQLATVYKHMTDILVQQGDERSAGLYARKALACAFSFKWALYTALRSIKGLFATA